MEYHEVIQELQELKRKVGGMVRQGTVHKQDGSRLRLNLGNDENGEKILTGWLNTGGEAYGNGKYSRWYGEPEGGQGEGSSGGGGGGGGGDQQGGQNLTLLCPNGDLSQGVILPYSPNNQFNRPKNATKDGKGGEFYQQKDYYRNYTPEKGVFEQWIGQSEDQQQDKQQGQQGQQGGGGGSSEGGTSSKAKDQGEQETGEGEKALIKTRADKENGYTHRVGNKVRSHVHKDGVKHKAGDNFSVVYKDGKLHQKAEKEYVGQAETLYQVTSGNPRVSKPWEIGKKNAEDKIKDDDK